MGKSTNAKYISAITLAACAAACFGILAWQYSDYMHKVEELSMFIGASAFFRQCMALPGGLLTWCSTALTSLLCYRYAGAALITATLLALQIASIRAFRLPAAWWPVSAVIALLPLLSFLRLGYDIFVIKPLGFAFAMPLGLIACALLYWGYRKVGNCALRCAIIAMIVVGGYPCLGFYALLGALMCACNNVAEALRSKAWTGLFPLAVAVIAIAIMPQLYFYLVESDLMPSVTYLSPLPRFFWAEITQWGLYALIFLLMLAAAWIAPRWPKIPLQLSLALWALGVAAVFVLRGHDKNLMHTLAIERALDNQQWVQAAKMANEIDFEPTRLNTALGYIAHLRNGSLGEQLFDCKYGWAPYASSRAGDPMHDAGAAIISYHLGLANYAYRWATEYMIEQGMSASRLKTMVKCALLNYETDLAKYYLDILYNMPQHRAWAKKYYKYAANPIEMGADPEMAAISALMCQPSVFINDGGTVEGYVWPLLASLPDGSPQAMQLSICAALICRDLEAAMAKIPAFVSRSGKATKAMQEAALFWAKSNRADCPIPIDPAVSANYDRFTKAFHNTSNMSPEEQRDFLRSAYENTLWYYLVFTEDKPIQ